MERFEENKEEEEKNPWRAFAPLYYHKTLYSFPFPPDAFPFLSLPFPIPYTRFH